MFKNIFARIWAVWGLLTFIISFIIFLIPSLFAELMKDPKGQKYFIAVSRVWMNIWLALVGCPVSVRGREYFKDGAVHVVVFNHNALLDVPLSSPYVPGANKTIAKSSFARVPIFGWYYKKGAILVDRKDEQSRVRSFEAMKRILEKGMHVLIYPEGTRNRTTEPLKAFYDGAFKLAIASGKSIIPCVITGTKKAMPINKTFYLYPTPLAMQFLPPVSPEGKDVKALKEEVYEMMKQNYIRTLEV